MSVKYEDITRDFPRHILLNDVNGSTTTWDFPHIYSWTNNVSSLDMPDYKRRIALGLNATTYRTGTKSTIKARRGSIAMTWQTSSVHPEWVKHVEVSGFLLHEIGFGTIPSGSVDEAENVAREKFYSSYRRATNAFQGGVFVGELGQTIRMLRSPAKALRSKVGDLYSKILKNKGKAGKTIKSKNRYLSQTWLEGSFGWAPLISDIKGAHEAFRDRWEYIDRELLIVKGTHHITEETHLPNFASAGYSNVSFRASARQITDISIRYKGAIESRATTKYTSEQNYWGFDATAIVPTVWELMPYSFLIDYFTNIGKVLDAVSNRRCNLAWGVRTTRRSAIRQFSDGYNNSNRNVVAVLDSWLEPGDWKSERSSFIRERIDTVPLPSLAFRLPGSSLKWLNLAALSRIKMAKF